MSGPARPAVHHRGAARRRRHAGDGGGREGRSRRLHGNDAERQPRAQSVGVQEHSLRQHQGFRADRLRRLHAAGVRAHPSVPAKNVKIWSRSPRRTRARHHLRLGRPGQRQPPGRRDAGRRGQREATARALSRRRAGDDRPARRARQDDVRQPRHRPAEHQGRQADRHGARGRQAAGNPAGPAHHEGGRLSARSVLLVRPGGPAGTPPAMSPSSRRRWRTRWRCRTCASA